jgi:adenylate cyclase
VAYLVILQGEDRRTFDLTADRTVVVGRARECDIHLDDPSLSRRHCELSRSHGVWQLKDLGSFNGTYCNDNSVQIHDLCHGDRIHLGQTTLVFTLTDEELHAVPAVPAPVVENTGMSRRLRNFMALLEITKAVSGELGSERLLEFVIAKALDLTNAQRGFLILATGEQLSFQVARNQDGTDIAEPEKQVSRSVIAKVVKSGEPVLTLDAANDLGNLSHTITNLEVRSLLCTPLKMRGEILGCLYVDSQLVEREFGEDALELLQAFADQAAIALRNATLFAEAKASREQEKRVRQVFQKYVPADVVRRALELGDQGKMSTKQVATVLFSDIRSFTSISERLEPEQVVSFLNDYLQRMVDIVFEEGGIVDKFIGDAVMAVFGAPFPKPDDATRAVRAGHRMLVELDRFNEDQARKDSVQIRIGIGIHTGPVIAGNIGSDRKMEYTVIGDTVNIASRVQDLNKEFGTELIITQATWDATRRRVPVRQLGAAMVKGKELPLQVYEAYRAGAGPQLGSTMAAGPYQPHAAQQPTVQAPILRPAALPGAPSAPESLNGPTLPRRPPPRSRT